MILEWAKLIKSLKKILKNYKLGAAMLIIGIIAALSFFLMSDHNYGGLSEVWFSMPSFYTAGNTEIGELKAVCDNYTRLYCIENDEKVRYILEADKLGFDGRAEFRQAVFDEQGKLYASVAVTSRDAYLTEMALILAFDENGRFIREICRYDYRDDEFPPQQLNPIKALNVTKNNIRYIYKDNSGAISLVSADKTDPLIIEESRFDFGEYNDLSIADASPDGSYCMILVNGDIVRAFPDGTYQTLYKGEFDLNDPENGFLPEDILAFDDHIILMEGLNKKNIYSLYDGEEPQLLYTARELAEEDDDPDDYYWSFYSLYRSNDVPAVDIGGYITELSPDGFVREEGGYRLPVRYAALSLVKAVLPFISAVLLLWGLVSVIGSLMHWRMSILSKQLLLTLPLVIAMAATITISLLNSIRNEYLTQCRLRMEAIIELSVRSLSGDKIEKMTTLEFASDGSLYELHDELRQLIGSNTSEWSSKYYGYIFLYGTDGMHFMLASGDNYDMPFTLSTYDESNSSDYSYISVYETESITDTYMCASAPILNSEGKQIAFYELQANTSDLNDDINAAFKKTLIRIVILLAAFIGAAVFITYISAGHLRKVKNAVTSIAGGDFSARIENAPKDEIGEICTGVNEMASQLEKFFEAKDRNEQFYYKFVPEKFRELLHKEDFTDLSLGDAESADLTVLFCDIRAFSLNSEMMTAKENFEFVNKIYGKAGPIIRNHNGFVDKYIGDAVMALFESADDAVNAGIELYRKIVLDPTVAAELGMNSINIGIGIHSGMARVGIVGEEERMSGTVISNTVNLSSRLESLTKKYSAAMIISKDTLDRMSSPDSLNMRYLGMVQVAGVNEVKALYEVLECLDDDRRNERTAGKDDFREAVREFHLGNAEKALSIFEKLAAESVNDPAPRLYADTIINKLRTGDKEHNVFRFLIK